MREQKKNRTEQTTLFLTKVEMRMRKREEECESLCLSFSLFSAIDPKFAWSFIPPGILHFTLPVSSRVADHSALVFSLLLSPSTLSRKIELEETLRERERENGKSGS